MIHRKGRRGAILAALFLALSAGAPVASSAEPQKLMQWPDLLGRPKLAERPERIRYGDARAQVIELWRPAAPGPHPVIAMIHGGCWTKSIASFHIMDWAAADLARRGVAVWNIEYRAVDEAGGGYPGAYEDVKRALDLLRTEAEARGLRTGRGLVVLGHSAGGHLALWSAKGAGPVRAVIDLAGLTDLERDLDTGCGPEPVRAMRGDPPRYRETSPSHMLPLGAELFVIHGAREVTVPVEVGARFAARARAAGDRVTVLTPPGAHVEEIAPGSEAWEQTIAPLVLKLTGEGK